MPQFSKHGGKMDSRELVVNPKPECQMVIRVMAQEHLKTKKQTSRSDVLTRRHQGTLPRSAFLGRVVDR